MSCTNGAGGLLRRGDAKDVLSEVYVRMREAKRETDWTIWGQGQERRGRWTECWRLSGGGGVRERQDRERKGSKKRETGTEGRNLSSC